MDRHRRVRRERGGRRGLHSAERGQPPHGAGGANGDPAGRAPDDLGGASFRACADAFRACAARLTDEGVDVSAYGLVQQTDDLEDARKALGYERIDLLSESAGTRTALIYAWRYPESVHRSVLVAANPPGHFLWDAKTTDEQIARYAKLCADDASCSERTDDLAASLARTNEDIPHRWGFLPIEESSVRVASFFGLMETTSEDAPLSAPMTVGSWLSAAKGDASGFWFQSLLASLFYPRAFVWGEYAAVARADAAAAKAYYSSGRAGRDSILGKGQPATDFLWSGGRLVSLSFAFIGGAFHSPPLLLPLMLMLGGGWRRPRPTPPARPPRPRR